MGQTIVEKIFSLKSNRTVFANDTVTAEIDAAMSNDASGPLTIEYLQRMEADEVANPNSIAFVIDHYVPCPDSKVAALQQSVYDFASRHGIRVLPAGEGIAHQVFDELGFVRPGSLIVGGDSHTTTYGYLNCLGIGIGSSDMAMVFQSGKLWFKVPETINIIFSGSPSHGISGKEIALHLLAITGPNGGNYKSIEYNGSGMRHLSMHDRRVICNMMAECGAKCSIMPFDDIAREHCLARGIDFSRAIESDVDCNYIQTIEIDLSTIKHLIACPHNPSNTTELSELRGMKVDMVLIGTCTNGKLEDFQAVYELLKRTPGNFCVETLIVPASRSIYRVMAEQGIVAMLLARGAVILPPSCGPCCGSSPGVPRNNFTVVSTANRNFLGRMGNTTANIYLTSPVVAAAAALTGRITDPKEFI